MRPGDGGGDARLHRVVGAGHRPDEFVRQSDPGKRGQPSGRRGRREHRNRHENRHGSRRGCQSGGEAADLGEVAAEVQDAEFRPGVRFARETGGTVVDRRRGGLFGHGDEEPGPAGERRETCRVEVEDRLRLREGGGGRVIAGHGEHAGHAQVGEGGELTLDRDAVAVAAGETGHHARSGGGEQERLVGRAERLPQPGRLTGDHGGQLSQSHARLGDDARVDGTHRKVGRDDRTRLDQGRERRRRLSSRQDRQRVAAVAGGDRSVHLCGGELQMTQHRGVIDERASDAGHFAAAVDRDTAAGPVDHAFRAAPCRLMQAQRSGHGCSSRGRGPVRRCWCRQQCHCRSPPFRRCYGRVCVDVGAKSRGARALE